MSPVPLAFRPLYQERIWGGRALQDALGRELPPGTAIGESWEVADRPEAQSVVVAGPLAGRELQVLWREDRERLFGSRAAAAGERVPLLVKLLDAHETLSVQVHPPVEVAEELGGEPKNEFWYVLAAEPGAHLLAGLREGVSKERFAGAMETGEDVSELLHRIPVGVGDTFSIPAGRVHALGAGCLVVEIQQNSDTTYRVYDFDRPGADGEKRELHVPESLKSIDFGDVEPEVRPPGDGVLADTPWFRVERRTLAAPAPVATLGECALVCVVDGEASCGGERFGPGSFFLVPADAGAELPVGGPAVILVAELPAEPG